MGKSTISMANVKLPESMLNSQRVWSFRLVPSPTVAARVHLPGMVAAPTSLAENGGSSATVAATAGTTLWRACHAVEPSERTWRAIFEVMPNSWFFWWRCFCHFGTLSLVNIQKTMKNHHFSWENPLFLWQFSIAMLNYQRVNDKSSQHRTTIWGSQIGGYPIS